MSIAQRTYRRMGHAFIEHSLDLPLDYGNPGQEKITVYAREIRPDGGEKLPMLVYFQGGPGFPAPRPTDLGGWLGVMLKKYRVLLLDQRGTGRSSRVDQESEWSADQLACLRADNICRDAEEFRMALGLKSWSLMGQSFGGFCITTYASLFPASIDRAYLTGGLPGVGVHIDDIYRATYSALQRRHDKFNAQFPWAEQRIREICHHLDNAEEILPTGERLSSRRFRTIGIELGRGAGFDTLAYLLEEPFRTVRGEKRLRSDFLSDVGARVSFAAGPLYAAIHEAIYAVPGEATNWSAHRIREEVAGFSEQADPRSSEPFYLTGEHIYPWQFEEDPALHKLADSARDLAQRTDWTNLYDLHGLGDTSATVAAAVYLDDIFVPFAYSMATSEMFRDARVHVTNKFQHDGLRVDGASIVTELDRLIEDH
ncbi:alpha/beta fold hydrolase [Corynebacterium sp. H130]|uniref:alpha/beta fold hydrolase n=1 Tax=Corynebacterium sp. H130 TaxID=3133444 RepID=UPI00309668A8